MSQLTLMPSGWASVVDCTERPTAPLCIAGQHLARWPLRRHLLLLFVRVCERVPALTLYTSASCHACLQPAGKTPDMRPHARSSSHSPSPFRPLRVPASRTCRWNRILTQCKLSFLPHRLTAFPTLHACVFPSATDIECVRKRAAREDGSE